MEGRAVLAGSGLARVAEHILTYGVDEVLVADDPLLEDSVIKPTLRHSKAL